MRTGLPSIERRVLLGGHARARRLDCYGTGLATTAVVRAADALALAPTVCPHPAGTIFALRGGRRPYTTTAAVVGLGAQRPVVGGASRAQPLPRLLRASHPERDGHLMPLKARGLYHSESLQHSCLSWQQGET